MSHFFLTNLTFGKSLSPGSPVGRDEHAGYGAAVVVEWRRPFCSKTSRASACRRRRVVTGDSINRVAEAAPTPTAIGMANGPLLMLTGHLAEPARARIRDAVEADLAEAWIEGVGVVLDAALLIVTATNPG